MGRTMIDNVDGEPIVWQAEPSERFISEGVVGTKKGIQDMFSSKPKTIYALTNNRALILEEKDGVCKILQQFPIDKATVSVLNRRQANAGFARDPRFDMGSGSDYKSNWQRTKDAYKEIYLHPFKTRAPVVIYKTAGDVVFFSQGKMVLKFTEVIEPDAVVDMAHKIVASKNKT